MEFPFLVLPGRIQDWNDGATFAIVDQESAH